MTIILLRCEGNRANLLFVRTSLANFQLPATLQQANNLLENSPNLDCVGDNNHQSPTITVYYKRNSGKTTYDLYHNFQVRVAYLDFHLFVPYNLLLSC